MKLDLDLACNPLTIQNIQQNTSNNNTESEKH